jgi:predicted CXXCH cytochrome family protein
MASKTQRIKFLFLVGFALLSLGLILSTNFNRVTGSENDIKPVAVEANSDDYVGSESCKMCHENQFNEFADTKHAKLANLDSWKGKVQGCESCHGPGKAHMEGGGDKSKILSFKGKTSKEVSETCLTCHSGKESHNNFRRGEHWRNDVGCTECHVAHGPSHGSAKADSITYPGDVTRQNPNSATNAMLKSSEPQLCISCHSEMKAQFSKPFHHKVLEGTMKCSDCHNAHGGFEAKQTKLAVGADASCVKCHADKQGPFAFEHAPLKTEGCAACHTPHGSANPKLLRRATVKQLCLECHTTLSNADPGAPQAPHNLTTARYNNCTTCHTKIHGSNAHKFFFR